jgi:hypothetical protein
MGCSPYFAVAGTPPILPFDIMEATYLQPPPTSILSSTDLIAQCAIALQKRSIDIEKLSSIVYQARLKAAHRFRQKHLHTLKDFNFD